MWVTGDSNAKLECGVKLCVLVPHDRATGEGEAEAEAGEPSDRDAGLTCEGVGGRKEHAATQKGFEKVSAGLMGSPGGRWSPKAPVLAGSRALLCLLTGPLGGGANPPTCTTGGPSSAHYFAGVSLGGKSKPLAPQPTAMECKSG